MKPPVRPPCIRCALFPITCLPHLPVLPATFRASSLFADLPIFPSLICSSCPSGQWFAYSFFQIPPRGGHPCCSAMYFLVARAYPELSPRQDVPKARIRKEAAGFRPPLPVLCPDPAPGNASPGPRSAAGPTIPGPQGPPGPVRCRGPPAYAVCKFFTRQILRHSFVPRPDIGSDMQ